MDSHIVCTNSFDSCSDAVDVTRVHDMPQSRGGHPVRLMPAERQALTIEETFDFSITL